MRKIDRIVFFSFIGPLIITFLITDFIFLLQFLWKYIDDLVGKGLEVKLIFKLVGLFAITIVPLALPLSILLSSIMTMGSMGENNELVACKSAGISLLRIMRSLIVFAIILAGFLFYFSNTILPNTHLKFYSLLYDIRKQKPALDIQEGVFYQGLDGYTLRISSKDDDDKTIYDIMVYDHTSGKGNDNLVMAEKGEMVLTADGKNLIMTLFNGKQYNEIKKRSDTEEELFERVEMSFSKWRKVFDLTSFDMAHTDRALFKDHYNMLNAKQLRFEIDTLRDAKEQRIQRLSTYNMSQLAVNAKIMHADSFAWNDSTAFCAYDVDSMYADFANYNLLETAINNINTMANYASVIKRDLQAKNYLIVRHWMELHRKFSLSIICLVLLFIGGPLGAIIRKGGFGYPVLIAIGLFLFFHVLNITGEKLSKEMIVSAHVGMWIPVMILVPIAITITYKALNERPLFEANWRFVNFIKSKVFKRSN